MYQPMFERDLLYPATNLLEPGSVHVSVLKPDIQGRLPIFITPKTMHNPFEYVDILVSIIQADIFDRTRIDIKTQGIFFFRIKDNEYIKLIYQDGKQIVEKSKGIIDE